MNHNEMKKNSKLSIYQSVILIAAAVIISLFPSLLIWKYHIMPFLEADVMIGLVCCYVISLIILCLGIFFLMKIRRQNKNMEKYA